MGASITEFRVTGLHGYRDVQIPIQDDQLIIVGVNGLGKTTIVNLFYFFLTRQWLRLLEYNFRTVEVTISGRHLVVRSASLRKWAESLKAASPYPDLVTELLSSHPDWQLAITTGELTADMARTLSGKFDINYRYMDERRLREMLHSTKPFDGQEAVERDLKDLLVGQVLYLPTYRRIERDLRALFPGLDRQLEERKERRAAPRAAQSHIELVEFGMRDVEQRLQEEFEGIKEQARHELNRLAATYLREVIRNEAGEYDHSLIEGLREEDIAAIVNRVQEQRLLEESDKSLLRNVISELRRAPNLNENYRYIAHFFAKLADIHRRLSSREKAVASMVDVCNKYLFDKHLTFDDKKYEIGCELNAASSNQVSKLSFSQLSSGEKQIVSLFTHIFLSKRKLLILIDEPELSLSVEWQKRLLPDVLSSGRCEFLLAATHSPFVFDNDLDGSAVNMRDFIVEGSQ